MAVTSSGWILLAVLSLFIYLHLHRLILSSAEDTVQLQQYVESIMDVPTNPLSDHSNQSSFASNSSALEFAPEHLAEGPHTCGFRKCFFPLKYNKEIAYLAGEDDHEEDLSDDEPSMYETLVEAYNVSKEIIERNYRMSHIYLSEPQKVTISTTVRQWMKANMTGSYTGQKHLPGFVHSHYVTQAVKIVPPDQSLIFGCKGPRLRDGLRDIDKLFTLENTIGANLTNIAHQASSDFDKLYRLLRNQPCLYKDFQIFLTHKGELIHFDVERCFPRSSFRS